MRKTALVVALAAAAASTAQAQPMISAMLPNTGHEGCTVTIIGTGFSLAPSVTFNGTPAVVALALPALIVCDVPVGATSGPVVVTVAGTASSGFPFTVAPEGPPTITSVFPFVGTVGSLIQIAGTNLGGFWCEETLQVFFDGVAAPWSFPAGSAVYTFVPAVAPGWRSVTVMVDGVASNALWFFVTGSLPAPSLSSIDPPSGPVRTVVTLTGSNFIYSTGTSFGYPTVFFGTTQIVPIFVSATQIVLRTPWTLPLGPVDVKVRVYNLPSLNYVDSNSVPWTVTPLTGTPVITSVTATGGGGYGSWYTVNGTGFLGDGGGGAIVNPQLFVNGQQAWVYYAADNLILAFLFAPTPTSGTLYAQTAGVMSNVVPFTIP